MKHAVMRFCRRSVILLLMLLAMTSASEGAMTMQDLIKSNTAFACDLYARLNTQEGNLFFSPYSISAALAMTYSGARGQTAQEIAEVFHFPRDHTQLHPGFQELRQYLQAIQQAGHVTLELANAVWLLEGYPFKEDFKHILATYYEAGLFAVDFARATEETRHQINSWVSERTHEKIPELIPAGVLDDLTRAVLTNAIYFYADWLAQFDPEHTTEQDFWVAPDESVSVPMMRQSGTFYYAETANAQILGLPYDGKRLYMVIALPRAKDGLPALEAQLSPETLDTWMRPLSEEQVRVALPKFKISSDFRLPKPLAALGMPTAFSQSADFSGIAEVESLYIADVIHKAVIEVDEKGTEAAAATAVVIKARSMPRLMECIVDHPFLFFIYDSSSESILFLGRVQNPAE